MTKQHAENQCIHAHACTSTRTCSHGPNPHATPRRTQEWELSGDEAYSARELFIYYCYSLQFVVALCTGRNTLARESILRASAQHGLGLELDTLQRAVANERLPFTLRNIMLQAG